MMSIPVRERSKRKRQTSRSPSLLLTSDSHMSYVAEKLSRKKSKTENPNNKQKATRGQRVKGTCKKTPANKNDRGVTGKGKPKSQDSTQCSKCFITYGTPNDSKINDEWVRCEGCFKWYHESCAEAVGIVDDDEFQCRDCL